jgi:hypothetical protein
MSGVEQVKVGGRQIAEVGAGAGFEEGRVVAAPDDQRGRLIPA